MQATETATTHPHSPYDVLRPMRCSFEFEGRTCSGRGGDIDWSAPGVRRFKCPKCKSFNVVLVIEAGTNGS